MNDWDNEDCGTKPGDTEPHGQKCLYKVMHKKVSYYGLYNTTLNFIAIPIAYLGCQ